MSSTTIDLSLKQSADHAHLSRPIQYLVFSDVHLGHRLNKTKTILSHLDTFFKDYYDRFKELDLIFIAGDLFDTLLDLSSEDVQDIMMWMSRLIRFCAIHQIKLRILEGTPSHDWEQSSMFTTIENIAASQVDFKYIKELSIEHIDEFGIDILYVPDEWHTDPKQTYEEVLTLLEKNHLKTIDIAIMHGQFTYQLPSAAIKAPRHLEQDYLNLVKHYIHIGHVHQFSTYERILAEGSFDRLCHGDEDPKGAIFARITPNFEDHFEFLVNQHATIFKTIRLTKTHFENLFQYLDKQIEKYPIRSFIRLKSKEKILLNNQFEDIKRRYPQYTLSKDIDSENRLENSLFKTELDMTTYSPIVIRKENITELLMESITKKYPLSDASLQLCRTFIEDTIRESSVV